MATASRPRQPKLRQSCDGCFIAKVKCSKQRPICTRCLSVGLDCRYSPSSRAGKVKSDSSAVTNRHAELTVCLPDPHMGIYHPAQHSAGLYRMETGWPGAPSNAMDGLGRSHSIPVNMSMLGMEDQVDHHNHHHMSTPTSDLYSPSIQWTTTPTSTNQADMSPGVHYPEPVTYSCPISHPAPPRSHSFDMSNGMMTPVSTWEVEPTTNSLTGYTTTNAPPPPPTTPNPNYFTSPIPTPSYRPTSTTHHPSRRQSTPSSHHHHPPHPQQQHLSSPSPSSSSSGAPCTCFTVCLQSLQALHNASGSGGGPSSCPPLDMVLGLNCKAVQGCAAMLACQRCMRRSGIHTAAMLLGTVMGKITSFYKAASRAYFDCCEDTGGGVGGMGLGTGTGTGQYRDGGTAMVGDDRRWLELEILERELRKLEEVYARFREVCSDLSEDPMQDVGQAMIGYLGQNLGDTLEVVSLRRDMGYP